MSDQKKRKRVRDGFERQGRLIPLDKLLPSKAINPEVVKKQKRYKTTLSSVREVGLVEPVIVLPANRGKHLVLDGHIRLMILRELEETHAPCLIGLEDDTFSYNYHVNRLQPIQEHAMILKAIKQGVPEARIAATLQVNVRTIQQKRNLLHGICKEAVDVIKDRPVTKGALNALRLVKPVRQIEIAQLMLAAGNYSRSYAEALALITPSDQRTEKFDARVSKVKGAEDIPRLQHELDDIGKRFLKIDASYGETAMALMVSQKYVSQLLDNGRVVRFLAKHYSDVLGQFNEIVEVA